MAAEEEVKKFDYSDYMGAGKARERTFETEIPVGFNHSALLEPYRTRYFVEDEIVKVMDTIVSAIKDQKMACLIIEHDMDIVSDYSDRVLVLSEGAIIADGKPTVVMEQSKVQETLFGVKTEHG